MQSVRNAKKCTKPASETEKKKCILKDEVYVYCICNESYAHQFNIIRHTKAFNGNIRKSRLQVHLKSNLYKCKTCNQRFKK